MRKTFILVVFLLFLVSVVSATTYVYEPDGSNSSASAWGIGSFLFNIDYHLPAEAILSEPIYWEVAAGYDSSLPNNRELENASVGDYMMNSTTLRFRINATYYNDNGGSGLTKWFVYNGSDYVLLKTTTASSGSVGTGATAGGSINYFTDNNFATGNSVYSAGAWSKCNPPGCDELRYVASTVTEEGVYYATGDLYDVVFYVRDPYQVYLSGARIVLTRSSDGVVVGNKTTDFSGAALFELAENIGYNISVTKDGYDDFVDVMTAIETTYAITLGFIETGDSPWSGFSVDFAPDGVLTANESYNFTASYNSSYYGVTGCWFSLLDEDDVVISTNTTVCASYGGNLSIFDVNVTSNSSVTARLTLEANSTQNLTYYFPYSVRSFYVGDSSLAVFISDLKLFSGSGFGDDERWFFAILFIFLIAGGVSRVSDLVGEPERLLLLVFFLTVIACVADFMPLSFIPNVWLAQYGVSLLVGLMTAAAGFNSWRLSA